MHGGASSDALFLAAADWLRTSSSNLAARRSVWHSERRPPRASVGAAAVDGLPHLRLPGSQSTRRGAGPRAIAAIARGPAASATAAPPPVLRPAASMGKKKKAAARLPQQWADAADAEKTALRDRAQSTVKKPLSRRQRRAAAAGWGDSSPEQEAPASAPPRPRPGGLRLRLAGDEGSESGEEQDSQVGGSVAISLHVPNWSAGAACCCLPPASPQAQPA